MLTQGRSVILLGDLTIAPYTLHHCDWCSLGSIQMILGCECLLCVFPVLWHRVDVMLSQGRSVSLLGPHHWSLHD